MIFFIVLPENRLWYFMQIVSKGYNAHVMSKPIFWEKHKKYFKMLSVEIFTSMEC